MCGLILTGDVLAKIDGHDVTNKNMNLCRSMIAGPEGTMVTLEFWRDLQGGNTNIFSVSLCRAVLDLSMDASLELPAVELAVSESIGNMLQSVAGALWSVDQVVHAPVNLLLGQLEDHDIEAEFKYVESCGSAANAVWTTPLLTALVKDEEIVYELSLESPPALSHFESHAQPQLPSVVTWSVVTLKPMTLKYHSDSFGEFDPSTTPPQEISYIAIDEAEIQDVFHSISIGTFVPLSSPRGSQLSLSLPSPRGGVYQNEKHSQQIAAHIEERLLWEDERLEFQNTCEIQVKEHASEIKTLRKCCRAAESKLEASKTIVILLQDNFDRLQVQASRIEDEFRLLQQIFPLSEPASNVNLADLTILQAELKKAQTRLDNDVALASAHQEDCLNVERDLEAQKRTALEDELRSLKVELAKSRKEGELGSPTLSPVSPRPSNPDSSLGRKRLPAGWREYWSESKNRPYYRQKGTGATFWEIPEHEWEEVQACGSSSGPSGSLPSVEEKQSEPEDTLEDTRPHPEDRTLAGAVANFSCECSCGVAGLFDLVAAHEVTCGLNNVQDSHGSTLKRWGCEFGCGFKGLFAQVAQHEMICDLNPVCEQSQVDENEKELQQQLAEQVTILLQQQELMEKEQLVLKTELKLSEVRLSAKQEELDELNESAKTVDLDSLKEIAIKYKILEQELLATQERAILLQDEKNASQSRDKVLAEDFKAVALQTDRLGLEVRLVAEEVQRTLAQTIVGPGQTGLELPIAVALTLDCDFDENMQDSESRTRFNESLASDLSAVLGVPKSSLQIVCHQRGSVVVEVVLTGANDEIGNTLLDYDDRTNQQLAQQLVDLVQDGDKRLSTLLMGKYITRAQVHGPIANLVCKAVMQAVESAYAVNSADASGNEHMMASPLLISVATETRDCPQSVCGTQTMQTETAEAETGTIEIERPRAPCATQTVSTIHVAASTQANIESLDIEVQVMPDVVGVESQTRPSENGMAVQATSTTVCGAVQATCEVAEMGTSTEEAVVSVVKSMDRTLASTLNAKWTFELTKCYNKNCMQRGLDGWRHEISEVHVLERKLAFKMSYFSNYLTRPVFQKWCHEMITTFLVRQKVESADRKRDAEILTDVFASWGYSAKSNFLRHQKGSRVNERVLAKSLLVSFVHWSHLSYLSISVSRTTISRAKRRLSVCLQEWRRKAKKQRGRFSKLAQRDGIRRRFIRSKYLHVWECHCATMRLRNKNRSTCERLHRRMRLSSIFQPWAIHTVRSTRAVLKNGQGKIQLLVHVCPPKRRILAHFLDLWTFGVTHRRKKANTASKASRKHAVVQKKQFLALWKMLMLMQRSALSKMTQARSQHVLQATFEQFIDHGLRAQMLQTQLKNQQNWTIASALDRWLLVTGKSDILTEDSALLSDVQNPAKNAEQHFGVAKQVKNPSYDESDVGEALHGTLAADAKHDKVSRSTVAAKLATLRKYSSPSPVLSTSPSSSKIDGGDSNTSFFESKVDSIIASRESVSSSSDDDDAPLPQEEQLVRSWGKKWQVNGLNNMHASKLNDMPASDTTSPSLARMSFSPRSNSSTPHSSMANTRARTSPKNRSPSVKDASFESPRIRAVASSPADLRSRPMPTPRSRFQETHLHSDDCNPPQHKKSLGDDMTSPKGAAKTPDLKELKMKLRLYD